MHFRLLVLSFIVFMATACGFAASEVRPVTEAKAKSDIRADATDKADYVLQPSDLIRVKVFQEEGLTNEMRVSQAFTVSLSLIGEIDVRNLTVRKAQEHIRSLYDRDYLVNPQVSLIVLEYSKRSVNVLGSVNGQGQVQFPPEQGLTLLDAISKAGGFSRLADRKRVKLTRTSPDGKKETLIINADDIAGGATTETWPLIPDDVIFVPERVL